MELKKYASQLRAILVGLSSMGVISCGGGGGGGNVNTPSNPSSGNAQMIGVTVSPTTANLSPGGTEQFSAAVTGTTNTAVTWSAGGVQGGNSTFGTINSQGLYTAPPNLPNPIGIKIVATSIADGTKSASATARVHDNLTFQNAPIKLGTSGGNVTDQTRTGNMIFCCSGTLGSLISRGGSLYILSNNHVLDKSDQGAVGDEISQPGLADTNCGQGSKTTVATMAQAVPLSLHTVDAAMAKVVGQTVDPSGSILDLSGIGQPAPPSSTVIDPSVGMSVSKSGDATGLTCSNINAIDELVQVTYQTQCQGGTEFKVTFDHQIGIAGSPFSDNGDSGSLVVETGTSRPVGLLYAGSDTGTVANPIRTVLNALKDPDTGEVPQIVGRGDHPVSCPATTQAHAGTAGPQARSALTQSEISRATLARNHRMFELMQDSAVDSVEVGRSDDNPTESAIVVTLHNRASLPIPAQVDGVRTKIVQRSEPTSSLQTQARQAEVAIPVGDSEITRARTAKQARAKELMANPAIIGVGVGASSDSPGESAVVVFVEQGKSVTVPAVIDGVRTRVIATDPFRTFKWGKSTVKACSRK